MGEQLSTSFSFVIMFCWILNRFTRLASGSYSLKPFWKSLLSCLLYSSMSSNSLLSSFSSSFYFLESSDHYSIICFILFYFLFLFIIFLIKFLFFSFSFQLNSWFYNSYFSFCISLLLFFYNCTTSPHTTKYNFSALSPLK